MKSAILFRFFDSRLLLGKHTNDVENLGFSVNKCTLSLDTLFCFLENPYMNPFAI